MFDTHRNAIWEGVGEPAYQRILVRCFTVHTNFAYKIVAESSAKTWTRRPSFG